ncbi:hypothetical protein FM036_04115 [Nostoc sp. HG1]|nr:hypothetical protein [Nostoc sp. HG1]
MGKTFLLRALGDKAFDTHESATYGIEIKWLVTALLQGF